MSLLRFWISVVLVACCLALPVSVQAQSGDSDLAIPNFWDKHERFQKSDLSSMPRLLFLTTTDFPPFNFIDRKKRLAGFNVDLAREICRELEILQRCQIQALPWDELVPAVEKGEAEAIIAGLSMTAEMRANLDFSRPYLQVPARFVTRKDANLSAPAYPSIFRNINGVVEGSAHQKYFDTVFSNRQSQVFKTRNEALIALKEGKIATVFSDALSLSFWLTSQSAEDCCDFLDGAFLSREYFGNGMSVAVTKKNPELAESINFALARINASGKFAELYLRYFPLGLF